MQSLNEQAAQCLDAFKRESSLANDALARKQELERELQEVSALARQHAMSAKTLAMVLVAAFSPEPKVGEMLQAALGWDGTAVHISPFLAGALKWIGATPESTEADRLQRWLAEN
ncbi:hypothetical protein [Cupriavidus sp. amp6]|uniref:hypothetical protein n=1 Tax=Cupriavidus sp. amp6 TaxID=388051 RepID=UPI0012EB4F49|nr:hypothetical protein [Cupriavidus sp. amp6]